MELDPARRRVGQPVAQHALGFGVRDEGDDIFPVRAGGCLLLRDFRERDIGRHYWLPSDPRETANGYVDTIKCAAVVGRCSIRSGSPCFLRQRVEFGFQVHFGATTK